MTATIGRKKRKTIVKADSEGDDKESDNDGR